MEHLACKKVLLSIEKDATKERKTRTVVNYEYNTN